ncbi:MAG: hypothetical protein FJW36_00870 [Acidobacteria bacterium]|nr:hypothetical protein [Acidobacteriota bacterium]
MPRSPQNYAWPDGTPFDVERHLFAPPPAEIGSVQIVSSTLPQSRVWTKALSSIGFAFRHTLGYIGGSGVACFECDRNPGRLIRREVLVFADAASLFKSRGPSTFEYLWKDPLDRLVFRYADSLSEPIPQDHIVHLLEAAEAIWTHRVLDIATGILERGGSVPFSILGKGEIRIRPAGLAIDSAHYDRADLEFFRRTTNGIEIHPSYRGEARGFRPWTASTHTVSNFEALLQLLVHALQLPHRD